MAQGLPVTPVIVQRVRRRSKESSAKALHPFAPCGGAIASRRLSTGDRAATHKMLLAR